MIISLVTTIGTVTASVTQNFLRNTSGSWCSCTVGLRQRGGVLGLAVVGAEPHVDSVVMQMRGRVVGVDLHAAQRIDCKVTAAEALAVAVEPVDDREHREKHDVEERRVVPREMRFDDV